jgi:DNA-directed RNA polymerase specialized sigma24 family protein
LGQVDAEPMIEILGARPWADDTRALRIARRGRRRGWLTTPRHLVERARLLEPQAVASLCGAYRAPVRNYLQQRGVSRDQAEDVTQGFFEGLLRRRDFSNLDPQGSFGAWLRTGAMRHLFNERDRESTGKRLLDDPKQAELRSQMEERQHATPERLLDRRCALMLIERAWTRLRVEYQRQDGEQLFEHLKSTLCQESTELSDAVLCQQLGHSVSYVGVARHRLRTREFPAALRAEFQEHRARERTPSDVCPAVAPASVDEEIRALLDALT